MMGPRWVSLGDRSVPTSGHTTEGTFTALAARRSWTLAEKQAILAEMAVPGTIVMELARRHGIAQSLLYRWRTDAAAVAARSRPPPAFVPVAIEAPSPVTAPPIASELLPLALAAPLASVIEIGLVCGRTLRVMADVDAIALARIVAALEGPPEARA